MQKEQQAQWRQYIEDYKKSGLSQSAFCKERNIDLKKFYYYNGSFKNKENIPTKKTVPFEPVKIALNDKAIQTAEIKLTLPNGFQCILPSHLESALIKRWVEALLAC